MAGASSNPDSTQYDRIGPEISTAEELPIAKNFDATVREKLGDICNLEVLDLACGDGAFAARFLQWGAARVTGVDISQFMVEKALSTFQDPRKAPFSVADCTKPLDKGRGRFDLVTGIWLLNYAQNKDELLAMWSNISRHLKPGGRFLGVVPSYALLREDVFPLLESQSESASGVYRFGGVSVQLLDRVEQGYRMRSTFHYATPVTIVEYMLHQNLHEECALEAGLENFRWGASDSVDMKAVDPETTSCVPLFQFITATCPS
ncbi:S-adenosyl-L-methionine-dependent methyltransferase [Aspergillus californicus]